MTTSSPLYTVSAANLFEQNNILNLKPVSWFTQPIASTSFVALRHSVEIPWRDVLSRALGAAENFLEVSTIRERRWVFFGACNIWGLPNAVTKHKRFWGANKSIDASKLINCSPEVEFTCDSKIRYAVCGEVTRESVADFAEWARSTKSGLMILEDSVQKQTEIDVKRYYDGAFADGDHEVDWSRAVVNLCPSGSVLIRFSGVFDDPDAAVDLIYDPRCVSLV